MPRGRHLAILLLLVVLSACHGREELPPQVLLRVAHRTVTLEQFLADFDQLLPRDHALPEKEEQALRRSYLAQRIDRELLLAEADRIGLAVSAEELQRVVADHQNDYPPGILDHTLADKGQTRQQWRGYLEEELLVEKVFDRMIRQPTTVSDEEISAWYATHRRAFGRPEQVRARQITLPDKAEAQRVFDLLRQGLAFEEAARRFSTSPDAGQGGDLGLFARGEMPEAFDAALFSLPVGRISEPVQSAYGFHIFLIEKHLQARQLSLRDVRDRIADQVRQQKEEQRYREWLPALREQASIEIDWTLL
jgi:parvulin-like peptidyl-prolyl isomerase